MAAHTVEITSGPPPDPNLTRPYIPLMKDTIDDLSKDNTPFDYGNYDIAYYNVGLGAKRTRPAPPKPSQEQVQDYFRRLGPARHPRNPSSEASRRRKVDRCLMAIRTLHQYKNENWDRTGRIDLTNDDRARDVPNSTWDDLPDPLPDWGSMSDQIKHFKANINTYENQYQPDGDLWRTNHELEVNSRNKYYELRRYFDACRASGFSATHATGDAELGVVNFPEDGNSLWYGPPMGAGSRETWVTLKYQIWNYFNWVLAHPSHPRHRLYVILQIQSSEEIEGRTPGSERLWGRMSILRALYTNKPDSGPPMYCHFRGIYQVIADFFGKEVVVFSRPRPAPTMAPDIRNDPPRRYNWRAYGSIEQGLDRGQILLVTDETMEQHQIAIYFDGHPEQYFDTSDRNGEDRYGWIDAPWMNRPLANDYEPIPLPVAPIDDNQLNGNIGSHVWVDVFGCGNACITDQYNDGMETVLPDPQQAGWVVEHPAPPFPNPNPYPVSDYKVTTGIYRDADGRHRWPQWDNIKAYESHCFQQHAKRVGINLNPKDQSV
ncbi:hypothetical protein CHU98_g7244 [Xylaria longipes]|nr:hypothetical protein CHU98_g7244 [Xylaria longipes]